MSPLLEMIFIGALVIAVGLAVVGVLWTAHKVLSDLEWGLD